MWPFSLPSAAGSNHSYAARLRIAQSTDTVESKSDKGWPFGTQNTNSSNDTLQLDSVEGRSVCVSGKFYRVV